jgi:AcrR family transcriptional regulator
VSRDDWVNAALAALTSAGITAVKVARLATELDVRRSSFYWYFDGRDDLERALLTRWNDHNVEPLVAHTTIAAPTITAAVLNLFEYWADPSSFDHRLEFAIRDWARRSTTVRARLEQADERRVEAIAAMHRRFGDDDTTAHVRARVQFHSQIGLYALGLDEPLAERLRLAPAYVEVFTGRAATPAEIASFTRRVAGRPAGAPVD